MNKYNFGQDTDYSVKVIVEQIGYDMDVLLGMSAADRFDFAITIVPQVKEWFANFRTDVETTVIVRAMLHALNVEVSA